MMKCNLVLSPTTLLFYLFISNAYPMPFIMQFSATRGVYATPTFFVNGFSLAGAGSPLDYNGWRKVIDPLLSEQGKKREVPLHLFL